ncbi:hypothetical protein ABW19_dt0206179 [Dactylella cylindrospora]|nr:hypothetical protein ABW19_dt0206179 [Dactylella cylindrospora]
MGGDSTSARSLSDGEVTDIDPTEAEGTPRDQSLSAPTPSPPESLTSLYLPSESTASSRVSNYPYLRANTISAPRSARLEELIDLVFGCPSLLIRILSFVHTPNYEFHQTSTLIDLYSNCQAQELYSLLNLKGVCRSWKLFIENSAEIISWQGTQAAFKAEDCLLHIPFFCWLGSNIRETMSNTLEPGTDFAELEDLFLTTDLTSSYISHPPVSEILLQFVVSRHPHLYQEQIGPLRKSLIYTLPISHAFQEDGFILRNPEGVKLADILGAILVVTTALNNNTYGQSGGATIAGSASSPYKLWSISIGMQDPDADTVFPVMKRFLRIFPIDCRLEVRDERYRQLEEIENELKTLEEEIKKQTYWRRTTMYPKFRAKRKLAEEYTDPDYEVDLLTSDFSKAG